MRIDLDKIEQNENSRVVYKEADLADLMASIKQHGLLQPVGVRKMPNGKYDAVYGNRRILAAKKLGWADIPAVVVEAETDVDRDILNLIENIKRKNTTLAEDGRMFLMLKNRGLSVKEIAARLDVSTTRIETALEVLDVVPTDFHRHLPNARPDQSSRKRGLISPTMTHELLSIRRRNKLSRPKFRKLLNAAKDGLNVAQIRKIAPLMRDGVSLANALHAVQRIESVALNLYIDSNEKERIEKKSGMGISEYLIKELLATTTLKTLSTISGGMGGGQGYGARFRVRRNGKTESQELTGGGRRLARVS